MKQVDGMHDGEGCVETSGFGLNLHGASDVAGDAGGAAGAADVFDLASSQRAGHFGLGEVVGPGGAAAEVGFGQGGDGEAGDAREQLAGRVGHGLGMGEVTGVVISDVLVDGVGRGRGVEFEEDLGDVTDFGGECLGGLGPVGVVAEEVIVITQHGAAAGDVGGDDVDGLEGSDVALGEFAGLVGSRAVVVDGAATGLIFGDVDLAAEMAEQFDGAAVGGLKHHGADAAVEQSDGAAERAVGGVVRAEWFFPERSPIGEHLLHFLDWGGQEG